MYDWFSYRRATAVSNIMMTISIGSDSSMEYPFNLQSYQYILYYYCVTLMAAFFCQHFAVSSGSMHMRIVHVSLLIQQF